MFIINMCIWQKICTYFLSHRYLYALLTLREFFFFCNVKNLGKIQSCETATSLLTSYFPYFLNLISFFEKEKRKARPFFWKKIKIFKITSTRGIISFSLWFMALLHVAFNTCNYTESKNFQKKIYLIKIDFEFWIFKL